MLINSIAHKKLRFIQKKVIKKFKRGRTGEKWKLSPTTQHSLCKFMTLSSFFSFAPRFFLFYAEISIIRIESREICSNGALLGVKFQLMLYHLINNNFFATSSTFFNCAHSTAAFALCFMSSYPLCALKILKQLYKCHAIISSFTKELSVEYFLWTRLCVSVLDWNWGLKWSIWQNVPKDHKFDSKINHFIDCLRRFLKNFWFLSKISSTC